MNIPKELQELRANIETLTKKYQEVKAMPEHEHMKEMEDLIFRVAQFTNERVSRLEEAFYNYMWEHSKGHLPSINSASKMEDALKSLGLDKDYQIYKPMIAAASQKYGFEVK